MAEKKEKKNGILKKILITITIIVFLAVMVAGAFFAIIAGILEIIEQIVRAIIQAVVNFLKAPGIYLEDFIASIGNFFKELIPDEDAVFDPDELKVQNMHDPCVVIGQDEFNAMRESIDNAQVNRNTAGLEDYMLKVMLLSYYRGAYLRDYNILMQITEDEKDDIEEMNDEARSDSKKHGCPFDIVEGDPDVGAGEKGCYYLETKGAIRIETKAKTYDTDYETKETVVLDYYDKAVLDKVIAEYNELMNDGEPDNNNYAKSMKEFLKSTYTTSDSGGVGEIQLISMNDITTKTWYGYDDPNVNNSDNPIYSSTTDNLTWTTVNYDIVSGKYGTPVEFLMNLLEVTGSQDFVNAFIEEVSKDKYYVKLGLYDLQTETSEVTQYDYIVDSTIKGEIAAESNFRIEKVAVDGSSTTCINGTDYDMNIVGADVGEPYIYILNRNASLKYLLYKDIDPNNPIEARKLGTTNYYGWKLSQFKSNYDFKKEKTGTKGITIISKFTEGTAYDVDIKEIKCWWATIRKTGDSQRSVTVHSSNITEAGRERIPTARTGNFALWKSFFARANGYVTRSDDSVTLTNESFNNSAKPNMFKDVTLGMSSNSDLALDWVLEEDSIFGVLNTDNRELLLKKFMREILRDPNVPFYYGNSDTENQNIRNAINNNNVEDSDYTVKELQLKYRDAIQNQIKIETRKLRNAGVAQGDFDLDGVLALLRKNGQVVKYADLYGNQTNPSEVGAGELLVNGAEMLFELLDSSENTEGMADIMRYLLYLYSGKDYGVTSFDDMILGELSPMTISGGNVEEKIWIALKNLGYNDFAAAAVLGNLSAESGGINSHYLETGKISGHNHESYTNAVNNGTYTNFANDGAGYGIAQWTYHTRKEGLLKYVRSVGKGIDDEDAQIEYLIAEIAGTGPAVLYASRELYDRANGYKPEDWENADNVATAALAFCWTYENPNADYANENKRITETQKYYDRFSGRTFMLGEDYTGTEGDKIVAAASNILEHTKSHRYSYVTSVPTYKRDGGPGVNNMPSERGICCASYVAWVLVESGVVSADYIDSLYFRGASEIGSGLSHIFPRVNKSEMQAGDIVVWGGHTQIFAGYDSSGNMWWYNGGVVDEIPPVKHSSYNAFSYFGNDCYILRPVQQ